MQCASAPSDTTQQSVIGLLVRRKRQGQTIYSYDRRPSPAEFLRHLRAYDRLVINLRGIKWQEVEREIERLGFGDQFLVSAIKGKHGERCKIEPWKRQSPVRRRVG